MSGIDAPLIHRDLQPIENARQGVVDVSALVAADEIGKWVSLLVCPDINDSNVRFLHILYLNQITLCRVRGIKCEVDCPCIARFALPRFCRTQSSTVMHC